MGTRDIDFSRWPAPAADLCEGEKNRVLLKQDNTRKFYEHHKHLIPEPEITSS
jgi:hypothetical protein